MIVFEIIKNVLLEIIYDKKSYQKQYIPIFTETIKKLSFMLFTIMESFKKNIYYKNYN